MEGDLRDLVGRCIRHHDDNPLRDGGHRPFCAQYGIDLDLFCYLFAKVVALEFAHGEMSYADGDLAMNQLVGIMDIDLRGFPLDVYLAFDQGEYALDQDPTGTIPWQKYTLPAVMDALAREGLFPAAH